VYVQNDIYLLSFISRHTTFLTPFCSVYHHYHITPIGSVYSVEVALDLTELEMLTEQRRNVRDALEKSIALWKATGRRCVIIIIIIIITILINIIIIIIIIIVN
jgi:hypothetical protein